MKSLFEYLKEQALDVTGYHGSGDLFKKFNANKARVKNDFYGGGVAYFSDKKEVAHTYAKSAAKQSKGEPHIYHTNLKMNNVFDVDHKFSGDKLKHVLPDDHESFARGAGLMKYGTDKHKVIDDLRQGKTELTGAQVFKGLSKGGSETASAREHLKSKGFDGLRYNGGDNMKKTPHNVYIPYKDDAITIHKVTKLVKKTPPKAVDEALKWEIPAPAGTTPIPKDHIRLYHQTAEKNLDSIRKTGIQFKHARGIEGPKAVYADEKGFYGKPSDTPTVEFHVHKDRFKKPFVQGDVKPHEIIATHKTWHGTARYIEDENMVKDVVDGKHDDLLPEKQYGKAIRFIKHKYAKTQEPK